MCIRDRLTVDRRQLHLGHPAVLDQLRQPFMVDDNELFVSASIGITVFASHSPTDPEAVSYTHLDVYKRQQILGGSAGRGPATASCGASSANVCRAATGSKRQTGGVSNQAAPSAAMARRLPSERPFWAAAAAAVSYTHLDVYKRQG